MKRRIIRLGTSTLVVSLPSKWTKQQKLSPGSEVELDEQGSNLLLKSEKKDIKQETSFQLTRMTESSIRTMITNAYRLGYDKIKVFYGVQSNYSLVRTVVKTRLIGFDITKQEKDFLVIENLTEPSLEQFDLLIEKMLFNIGELFLCAKDALEGKKSLSEYHDIEEKIQQYDNFCKRVVSKKQPENLHHELFWLFSSLLVHGQREIYFLIKHFETNTKKMHSKVLHLLEECSDLFENLKRSYFKSDIALLEEVHGQEKNIIYQQSYRLLESGKDGVAVHHLASAARNFYLSASPLMGLVLSRNLYQAGQSQEIQASHR